MEERHIRIFLTPILLFAISIVVSAQDDQCGNRECPQVLKKVEYGLPEEVILAYEDPEFEALRVDAGLLHDRRYMQVAGMVNVYDAPNGSIVRTIDQGFSYVTVIDQQGDWSQVNPGEWVHSVYLRDANTTISEFTGVFLPEVLPAFPIAWMLVDTIPSRQPGATVQESNGRVSRYRLVSLFDAVDISDETWYQIGIDQWVDQTRVAQVHPVIRPEEVDTQRWISIDLYEQVLLVYDGETPIFATLVSAGLPGWPTYQGLFHITLRMPRRDMSWGTPGKDFYYLEEVPWTMFFDNGRALHGTYWHDSLGYLRSRGCLNMSITDAHWLFLWVAEQFGTMTSVGYESGPAVYIYSSDDGR